MRQVLDAACAVRLLKVDVVRVDSAVNDSRHHAFARVGFGQSFACLYLINTDGRPSIVRLLLHVARQLHLLYSVQLRNALHLVECDGGQHDIPAACIDHDAFLFQLLVGHIILHPHHYGRVAYLRGVAEALATGYSIHFGVPGSQLAQLCAALQVECALCV